MKRAEFEKQSTFTFLLQDKKPLSPITHQRQKDELSQSLFSELFSKGSTPRSRDKSFSNAISGELCRKNSSRQPESTSRQISQEDHQFMNRSRQILRQFLTNKENLDSQSQFSCKNHPRASATHTIQLNSQRYMLCTDCAANLAQQGFEVKQSIPELKFYKKSRKQQSGKVKNSFGEHKKQLQRNLEELEGARERTLQQHAALRTAMLGAIQQWMDERQQAITQSFQALASEVKLKIETLERVKSRPHSYATDLVEALRRKVAVPEHDFSETRSKLQQIQAVFTETPRGEDKETQTECQQRVQSSRFSFQHRHQQIQGIQRISSDQSQEEELGRGTDSQDKSQCILVSMQNPLDWQQ